MALFKAGRSGNPNGRPKGNPSARSERFPRVSSEEVAICPSHLELTSAYRINGPGLRAADRELARDPGDFC